MCVRVIFIRDLCPLLGTDLERLQSINNLSSRFISCRLQPFVFPVFLFLVFFFYSAKDLSDTSVLSTHLRGALNKRAKLINHIREGERESEREGD